MPIEEFTQQEQCPAQRGDQMGVWQCSGLLGHHDGHRWCWVEPRSAPVPAGMVDVTSVGDEEPSYIEAKHQVVASGTVIPLTPQLADEQGVPLPSWMQRESDLWMLMAAAMDNFDGTEVSVDECIDKIMLSCAPMLAALVEMGPQ